MFQKCETAPAYNGYLLCIFWFWNWSPLISMVELFSCSLIYSKALSMVFLLVYSLPVPSGLKLESYLNGSFELGQLGSVESTWKVSVKNILWVTGIRASSKNIWFSLKPLDKNISKLTARICQCNCNESAMKKCYGGGGRAAVT